MIALLLAAQLAAQPLCTTPDPGAGFVCQGGQWLPPGHPSIRTPEPQAPICDPRPNPYTEHERAAACTAWELAHTPTPPLPTFEVRRTYRDAYDTFRMVVLAVSLSLEGVPVVTAQYVQPVDASGTVFSFRVDQGVPWQRVD